MALLSVICSAGVIGRLDGPISWWHLLDLFTFSLHMTPGDNSVNELYTGFC